jgi:hypothetical protein
MGPKVRSRWQLEQTTSHLAISSSKMRLLLQLPTIRAY